jgi:hypothetical protein
VQLQ